MKTASECLPCLTASFANIARMATDDETELQEIACGVCCILENSFKDQSPADIGTSINKLIMNYCPDPFEEEKIRSRNTASEIFDDLSSKPLTLGLALHAALLGNILDFSVQDWDHTTLDTSALMEMPFAVDDSTLLDEAIKRAHTAVYLTDNAGEVVLDYFLIRYMKDHGIKVIVCPKAGPIQNDATAADLEGTKTAEIADILISAPQSVGLGKEGWSREFRDALAHSDLIIYKGMGYYENAFDRGPDGFFIFKAKCIPVARSLGVQRGDNIVIRKNTES